MLCILSPLAQLAGFGPNPTCLKPFIVFSLTCRSPAVRKRSIVWLRVIQLLLLPNPQSQKVKYFVVFVRIIKAGSPLADI